MQTLEVTNENVLTVRDDEVKEGWERWYLLLSDIHLDNPHCQRDMLKDNLEEAHEREAKVFSFGDLFCAMEGKYDPRRSKKGVLPENNNEAYLDSLVKNNAKFLDPWSDDFELFTDGNHETAILSHCETDLTGRLAERLQTNRLGYSGYIKFLFSSGNGGRTHRDLFFHHEVGGSGGGEMTKGMPNFVKIAAWVPDADIIVGGHIHESWLMRVRRSRLTSSGRTYKDYQYHVQLGTYKDEFDLNGGYHVQKRRPPKPLGGSWLQFYYNRRKEGNVGIRLIQTD